MGISSCRDDFVTSADVTADRLLKQGFKKIYVLGTEDLKASLSEKVNITDVLSDDIDCLCIGFDTELTFKKIEDACSLLRRKSVAYIATNPDMVCPVKGGYVPDCGSVSEMLFNAAGRRPVFAGKPNPDMAYAAMKRCGIGKNETAVVGDRIYTDIACGKNAGTATVFLLSGEGVMSDIQKYDISPTFVYNDIKQLLEEIK